MRSHYQETQGEDWWKDTYDYEPHLAEAHESVYKAHGDPEHPEVRISPHPGMQQEVFKSNAKELLMGGMAGPGKSWTLLNINVPDLFQFADLRALTLRREAPRLGELLNMAYKFYTPWGVEYSGQDRTYGRPTFTFPHPDYETFVPGAKAVFGHMQYEMDKMKYGGFEWHRQCWDELAEFLESQYRFMFSRLRGPGGAKTLMRSSANPNGVGMLWVMNRFVTKVPAGEIKWFKAVDGVDAEVPEGTRHSISRTWIPGDRKDNDSIDQEDYEANLSQLSKEDQSALKYGIWMPGRKSGQLIEPEWWEWAVSGDTAPVADHTKHMWALACDYAHEGADSTIIMEGFGNTPSPNVIEMPMSRKGPVLNEVAARVMYLGKSRGFMAVDGNGNGSGLCDDLEDIYGYREILHRCMHKDPDMKFLHAQDVQFDNFRSQMWWQLREDFQYRRIDLSKLKDWDGMTLLHEEVLAHTFDDSAGKIKIIPKKILRTADQLGRSPDRGDTLTMWNYARKKNEMNLGIAPASRGDYGGPFNSRKEEEDDELHADFC